MRFWLLRVGRLADRNMLFYFFLRVKLKYIFVFCVLLIFIIQIKYSKKNARNQWVFRSFHFACIYAVEIARIFYLQKREKISLRFLINLCLKHHKTSKNMKIVWTGCSADNCCILNFQNKWLEICMNWLHFQMILVSKKPWYIYNPRTTDMKFAWTGCIFKMVFASKIPWERDIYIYNFRTNDMKFAWIGFISDRF